MKNKMYRFPIKAAAVILSVVLLVMTVGLALGTVVLAKNDYYFRSKEAVLEEAQEWVLNEWNHQAYYHYENFESVGEFSENYYYEIKDEAGGVLVSTYSGQKIRQSHTTEVFIGKYDEQGNYIGDQFFYITGYLADPPTEKDISVTVTEGVSFLYAVRYWIPVLAFLFLLAEMAVLIYLFCAVGNHPGEEKPRLNPTDRIPFDIATVALMLLVCLEFWIFYNLYDAEWQIIFGFFFAVLDYLLGLWYVLSFAARVKVGGLWRNTLIGRFFRGMKYLLSRIPLVWKTALILGGITLMELIFMVAVWNKSILITYWFLEKMIVIPAVLMVAISLRRLQKGGSKLAEGALEQKVDATYLWGDFKRFAETLNSIGDGMNKAVEERMKSERFKTELITNVSHDIKTPLTSIINYVDLIKKEEPGNERVGEYLEVLDRQSARLKKLIEDLVEASKASTGNLPVHPEPCDTGVLLTQMVGEYDARFRQKELELILHQPEEAVLLFADPRHLWRILDNLMGNIGKYAKAGTRVYLDLEVSGGEAVITFRNISDAPLNVSGEELMERFVRGDSSRNTEGSGLGLSIARSLCELQGGTLDLRVDGDFFKVVLRFPRMK